MAGIEEFEISDADYKKLLSLIEGHFADLKAKEVGPGKLTCSLSAFANAEGGELFIGIEEKVKGTVRNWNGFTGHEDANGHIQSFETVFPLGQDHLYSFLKHKGSSGYVLKIEIQKTREMRKAANGKYYIRRGAQNLPVFTEEDLQRLKRNKGITSFETEPLNADHRLISNSTHIIGFIFEVIPHVKPELWLKKQQLIIDDKPTVAGIILFAEEP